MLLDLKNVRNTCEFVVDEHLTNVFHFLEIKGCLLVVAGIIAQFELISGGSIHLDCCVKGGLRSSMRMLKGFLGCYLEWLS